MGAVRAIGGPFCVRGVFFVLQGRAPLLGLSDLSGMGRSARRRVARRSAAPLKMPRACGQTRPPWWRRAPEIGPRGGCGVAACPDYLPITPRLTAGCPPGLPPIRGLLALLSALSRPCPLGAAGEVARGGITIYPYSRFVLFAFRGAARIKGPAGTDLAILLRPLSAHECSPKCSRAFRFTENLGLYQWVA